MGLEGDGPGRGCWGAGGQGWLPGGQTELLLKDQKELNGPGGKAGGAALLQSPILGLKQSLCVQDRSPSWSPPGEISGKRYRRLPLPPSQLTPKSLTGEQVTDTQSPASGQRHLRKPDRPHGPEKVRRERSWAWLVPQARLFKGSGPDAAGAPAQSRHPPGSKDPAPPHPTTAPGGEGSHPGWEPTDAQTRTGPGQAGGREAQGPRVAALGPPRKAWVYRHGRKRTDC